MGLSQLDLSKTDIYFDPRYSALYAGADGKVETFSYGRDNKQFLFTFIKKPINGEVIPAGFSDFETAYGYGGPLSTSDDKDFLTQAWKEFQSYCETNKIVAGFVRFHPLLQNEKWVVSDNLRVLFDRETVQVDLTKTEDEIMAGYASDNRSKIRKSMNAGVTVRQQNDKDGLTIFGKLYETRMNQLGATEDYYFGAAYFDAMAQFDGVRVYLAEKDGTIIGGALVLLSDQYAHYHLSSSLKEHFKLAPNNILRHAVITSLLGGPQKVLHTGGGRSSDPEDSLLQFKTKFSKERAKFYIGKYVAHKDHHQKLCDWWDTHHKEKNSAYANQVLRYRRVS